MHVQIMTIQKDCHYSSGLYTDRENPQEGAAHSASRAWKCLAYMIPTYPLGWVLVNTLESARCGERKWESRGSGES